MERESISRKASGRARPRPTHQLDIAEDALAATNILVLGCGGGNLATRLARLGKNLTIVDNNPVSFVIAQRYFGLPDGLPLIVSDFRKFIFDDDQYYDGIAIDVGGPDFCFDAEFDLETCDAIRARLAPGGRIVMNVLVANDIDQVSDRIAARLAGDRLRAWIIDEPGVQDRNAIIACVPERQLNARPVLAEVMQNSLERWSIRRGRSPRRSVGDLFRR
jgi:SAM-dependent methyltransferase